MGKPAQDRAQVTSTVGGEERSNRHRELTGRRWREQGKTGECGMTNQFDCGRKGRSGVSNAA